MILSDGEIREAIKKKRIIIDPEPNFDQYSRSALDLHIGSNVSEHIPPKEIKMEGLSTGEVLSADIIIDPSKKDIKIAELLQGIERPMKKRSDGNYLLRPNSFALAKTKEFVELPTDGKIAAWVEGRSSLARLGMGIHVTAPIIHSGWSGRITLEIFNIGNFNIILNPNELVICQLVFETMEKTPEKSTPSQFAEKIKP